MYRQEGDWERKGEGARRVRPFIDWAGRAEQYARGLSAERQRQLAQKLGLPETVIAGQGIGFLSSDPLGVCWTFPECNGKGEIVGIGRRFMDGSKMAMGGGHRGLFLPRQWREREGEVLLCPEGASDTLALAALNLPAVGRPANMGGVEQLAELIASLPGERSVVIVGENDRKANGDWPGRRGAEQVARQLARKLGRTVCWVLPPGDHKDVRAWVQSRKPDPTCAAEWHELGQELLAEWEEEYRVVKPDLAGEYPGLATTCLAAMW
jgi:hypothetical protein